MSELSARCAAKRTCLQPREMKSQPLINITLQWCSGESPNGASLTIRRSDGFTSTMRIRKSVSRPRRGRKIEINDEDVTQERIAAYERIIILAYEARND